MSGPKTIRKPTLLDLFLLITTMATWGLAFVAMKIVVPETGPYWLTAYRSLLGCLFVLPIALWIGFSWPKDWGTWSKILLISALMFSLPVVLISAAVEHLDAGVASLLMGTGPFLAILSGHFVAKDEKMTFAKVVAVVLGMAGILTIVGPEAVGNLGSANFYAQLTLIAASACYVTAGYTIRRIQMPFLPLTALCLLFGSMMMVPVSLILSGAPPISLTQNSLLWMLFLGVIASGLAFIVRFYLIQNIGYSMFALGVNMIPVFGVLMGALVLGEVITLKVALALAFVMSGIFIARWGS